MTNKRLCILVLCLIMCTFVTQAFAEHQVLYKGLITRIFGNSYTNVYASPNKKDKVIASLQPGTPIQIVEVLPNYVGILRGKKIGYVLRHRIQDAEPIDPVTVPRFGTAVNRYYATCVQDTPVYNSAGNGEVLITLHKGAMIGFLDVHNGWGRTIFKRQFGYVDTRLLTELLPVAEDISVATDDRPISVYNSFYNIQEADLNKNRMVNLAVCAKRTNRVMQPGDILDFNNSVGPFTRGNGYLEAGALLKGEWSTATGGGSCQASSTLYNAVLQLTGLTVLRRAPHGANGARYLPHGVDASSGKLNFVFRNDYPFPVTIRSHVQDGSFFYAIYKGAIE